MTNQPTAVPTDEAINRELNQFWDELGSGKEKWPKLHLYVQSVRDRAAASVLMEQLKNFEDADREGCINLALQSLRRASMEAQKQSFLEVASKGHPRVISDEEMRELEQKGLK